MRVPAVVRWPGVIEPGTKVHDIMSHEDWLPTLLAAAGEGDVVAKLKKGHRANGKRWRVHPDGYNFMPYFRGEARAPREEILYFNQAGDLDAVRWNDWKISFATFDGNIATGVREIANWPVITHLRADPYEEMHHESMMYTRWYADNMWLFVPIQDKVQAFLSTIGDYPFQEGQALNAAGIGYQSLKSLQMMQELTRKGILPKPE
jgi:arylsulfatase